MFMYVLAVVVVVVVIIIVVIILLKKKTHLHIAPMQIGCVCDLITIMLFRA